MKKPRFTEQQIAVALRQAEQGTPTGEICGKLGVSEATFYAWKKRYAGRRRRATPGAAARGGESATEAGSRRPHPGQTDPAGGAAKKGLRPGRRRAIAREVIGAYRVSARRACHVVGCHRATFYYRTRRRDVTPLRMRLRELAAARPRFGYQRLHILLRREGWPINAKKTYRLYREEALGVRVKRATQAGQSAAGRPARPGRPNEQWCMDFMADRLEDGRRIRLLKMEDVFTRECLAVEVDVALTSVRVVSVLDQLVVARGAPTVITVDNGSEFYSRRTDAWAYQRGVRLLFSRPGKPMDNPFIESFNGRLRDEHLNVELFFSVTDAQRKILEWQRDYNEDRPHSSLGDISPREFAAQWQLTEAAGGQILNPETV